MLCRFIPGANDDQCASAYGGGETDVSALKPSPSWRAVATTIGQHLGHALERQRDAVAARVVARLVRPREARADRAQPRARGGQVRIEALAAALERVVAAVARVLGERRVRARADAHFIV